MSDQLVESPMEEIPEISSTSDAEAVPQEAAEVASPDVQVEASSAPVEAAPSPLTEIDESAETEKPAATSATEASATDAEAPKSETPDSKAAEESSPAATTEVSGVDAAAPSDSTSPPESAGPAEEATPAAEASQAAATDAESEAEKAPKVVDGTKPADANSAEMIALQQALEDEALVEGQVIGWNKGGYHVALGKIAAFCPVSQIEIGNPRAPKRYLDKTFKFRVIEIQDGGRRVVVSRSTALEAERTAKAEEIRGKLVKGAVLDGRVSSLTDFGAFVNLGGGVEGLVHISEISRRRVEHPKDALKHRQKVKVSVLKIENGGKRISLSMKALEADPWKNVAERYEVGAEFEGTILRRTDFGLFVEVEPGLEGLVHVSRLPIGIDAEDESLAVGQTVKGWVHEVDAKRRRLSLSLREVAANDPWKGLDERFREGEVITGKVERIANFGAFVELEPGLTGLLSFSAVNTAPNANLRKQFHPGREIKVRILSIDKGRRRISLGTELSKAEGSQQDYREYLKEQKKQGGGLNSMAAAFAKLKDR